MSFDREIGNNLRPSGLTGHLNAGGTGAKMSCRFVGGCLLFFSGGVKEVLHHRRARGSAALYKQCAAWYAAALRVHFSNRRKRMAALHKIINGCSFIPLLSHVGTLPASRRSGVMRLQYGETPNLISGRRGRARRAASR